MATSSTYKTTFEVGGKYTAGPTFSKANADLSKTEEHVRKCPLPVPRSVRATTIKAMDEGPTRQVKSRVGAPRLSGKDPVHRAKRLLVSSTSRRPHAR
jgi:hypothetical protein